MRRLLRPFIAPLARYCQLDPEVEESVFYGFVGLVYADEDNELRELPDGMYTGRDLVRFQALPTGYLSNTRQVSFRALEDLPPIAGMSLYLDAGETENKLAEFPGDEPIYNVEAGDVILFSPGRIYIRFRGQHLSISILGVS